MSVVDLNKNQYKFATSIDIKNVVNLFFFFFFLFFCVCIISSMIFNSTIQFIQIYIAASSSFYSLYRISKKFETYSKLVPNHQKAQTQAQAQAHQTPTLPKKKKSTTVCRIDYLGVLIKQLFIFLFISLYIYIYIYKYKTAYKVVEASSSTPFFLYGIKIQREREIRNSEIRTTSLQIHHRLRTKKQCLRVHHSAAMKRHRSSASSAQPQHLFSLVNFLFNPN